MHLKHQKIHIKILIFLIILFGYFRRMIVLRPSFKTIFSFNEAEIFEINQRRGYYPKAFLGKIGENKITYIVAKFQKNFFQLLDPNFFFFANHPRERVGVSEQEKFHWLLLPIFIFGLFWQFRKKIYIYMIYFFSFTLIISLFERIDDFVFFLFPFLILTIYFGFYFLWEIYVVYKKNKI